MTQTIPISVPVTAIEDAIWRENENNKSTIKKLKDEIDRLSKQDEERLQREKRVIDENVELKKQLRKGLVDVNLAPATNVVNKIREGEKAEEAVPKVQRGVDWGSKEGSRTVSNTYDIPKHPDLQLVLDSLNGNEDSRRITQTGISWTADLLRKNHDYGSSVWKAPILDPSLSPRASILVRMSDKVNRISTLQKNRGERRVEETLEDTIKDLGSYCLLYLAAPQELSKDILERIATQTTPILRTNTDGKTEVRFTYIGPLSKHALTVYEHSYEDAVKTFRKSLEQPDSWKPRDIEIVVGNPSKPQPLGNIQDR